MKVQSYEEYLREMALRQWRFMYIHGDSKQEALHRMGVNYHESPRTECYACECARARLMQFNADTGQEAEDMCIFCPVTWVINAEDDENFCCEQGSPYEEWDNHHKPRQEKLCAWEVYRTIRDTWK